MAAVVVSDSVAVFRFLRPAAAVFEPTAAPELEPELPTAFIGVVDPVSVDWLDVAVFSAVSLQVVLSKCP